MGNIGTLGEYKWGSRDDEGYRYVHSLAQGPVFGRLKHVPREFDVVGVLKNGLECDLSSFEGLTQAEPTAVLEGLGEDEGNILALCRMLEEYDGIDGYKRTNSMTEGNGIVLTFPMLLEVSTSAVVKSFAEETLSIWNQTRDLGWVCAYRGWPVLCPINDTSLPKQTVNV